MAAKFMFMLFKSNVDGSQVPDGEYLMAIDDYEKNRRKASNLA